MTRTTHTYAKLPVTEKAFQEIRHKLITAGYDEATEDPDMVLMTGIAIIPAPQTQDQTQTQICNHLQEKFYKILQRTHYNGMATENLQAIAKELAAKVIK